MKIARSAPRPGAAGVRRTSSGLIAFSRAASWAEAGAANNSNRKRISRAIAVHLSSIEVGPQPPLRRVEVDPAPGGIFRELVAADLGDPEIVAVAVAEIEAADRRGRKHREILGQAQPRRIA